VLFAMEFINDLRRVVKRAVHPRMIASLAEETIRKHIPAEIAHDPEKVKAYMDGIVTEIQSMVNGLNPEEALVAYDTISWDILNNGNATLSDEYKVMTEIINAKVSTGAKALPSILGHGSGSQNVASSETLLFMKNAEGAITRKLNEIYSRALTLAVRLFGQDVYVEFRYAPIDLRPEGELEAFKSQKQSRILELLSIGQMTDEEASLELTGRLPPAGAPKLSGTFFFQAKQAEQGNLSSNTSNLGGTFNQATRSTAPKQAKGAAK
jgi:hypothetical protein